VSSTAAPSTFLEPVTVPEPVENANLQAINEVVEQKQQVNPILENINSQILEVSQAHMNEVLKDLKQGMIRLEYIDSKGKMQIDRRQYNPMSIGMNKEVVRVGKRIRLLRADIKDLGKEGGMTAAAIQKKYPDILDDYVDESDLTTEQVLAEMIFTFIFTQKAKIYWGITNADNYSLHDIMIVATLYESRNNFNPSLLNPQR
jgi:hypothetical protein